MSPPCGWPHQLPRTFPAISLTSERTPGAGVSATTRSRRTSSSASSAVRSIEAILPDWPRASIEGRRLRTVRARCICALSQGASMKIHEYQAKEILRRFGVAVPRGKLATSPEQAVAAARELMTGKPVCVVKAQIHAGGRGKGGGVKLAKSPEQAGDLARAMLGMQLVTHQTGPQGQKV